VIIVTVRLSGPLAAWCSAWLQGHAAFDEALSHAAVPGATVADHTRDGGLSSVGEVLVAWRLGGAKSVRAVFPAAGDVRGVTGPALFRAAALDAGSAVYAGALGLVPEERTRTISSARELITWHAYDIEPAPLDYLQVEEAAHDLTSAIRESASALAAAEVAGWIEDVREELSDARRAGERLSLPEGYPQRAVLLLAQAERLAAVLDVAKSDPIGGAIDRTGIAARDDALRPLVTAVRRARVAGYNALDVATD
jgi:hypothetical protein